jgi:ubiquinone biosynthesis protein Coq4
LTAGAHLAEAARMSVVPASFRTAWEAAVRRPTLDVAPLRDALVRDADPSQTADVEPEMLDALLATSVLLARVAWIDPGETIAVYDDLASRWLDGTPLRFDGAPVSDATLARVAQPGELPSGAVEALWQLAEDGIDAATITARVAAFGAAYPAAHRDKLARAMEAHPGWEELARKAPMPRTRLDDVAGCAPGTLGHAFYRLIVDNGYDIEVMDPDSVVGYHPVIDPTSRRILQTHEIFHLVAGYSTSALQEVGISGFQLAQFGHNYSRDFLAAAFTVTTVRTPNLAPIVLQVTLEGWRHGRKTPPLMLVDWHEAWNETIETLRARHGIAPYESLFSDIPVAPAA